MVAASNRSKIDARLTNRKLAEAIRNVGRLPMDSVVRRRLEQRGLPCNMNGIIHWLFDDERAAMLVDEIFNGGY
jgi:hypothetical protein